MDAVRAEDRSFRNQAPEQIYSYRDRDDNELFQVLRYSGVGKKKTFLQRHRGSDGRWIDNLDGVKERPLYQLPRLLAALKAGEPVLIVEGERDVETALGLGITATCNPGGAGKWKPEHSEVFRGSASLVTVAPDKDEPGRAHARAIVAGLASVGATARLAEARFGKDFSDHVKAGHTFDDLVPVAVEDLEPVENESKRGSEKNGMTSMATTAAVFETLACDKQRCECRTAVRRGKGNTHCPVSTHPDLNPSFTVNEGADGRILVNCKAGCAQDVALDALRELNLLPPTSTKRTPTLRKQKGAAVKRYFRTDSGNGELIARLNYGQMRFDRRQGTWMFFEEHRWKADIAGHAYQVAKLAARHRREQAKSIDNLQQQNAEVEWATASENASRIEAALKMAATEPGLADDGERWDADPWLLGCANGVLDLKTGECRKGRAEDRITMSCRIRFDVTATCPRWQQFIAEVLAPDLVDYVRRAIAYSLTGLTTEQVLFLLVGSGKNGKSVLQTVLRALAGEYAANVRFETFSHTDRGQPSNDIAALAGKRVVSCGESLEGARLNESRVKSWVHGDEQTARFHYREFFSFTPTGKLWLATNHRPTVKDDSFGFWRSVHVIPFDRVFDGEAEDRNLTAALLSELPGILTWALEGLRDWQQGGLRPPEAVRLATNDYRQEQDELGDFLEDWCRQSPDARTEQGVLFSHYRDFCQHFGHRESERMTARTFYARLGERFGRTRSHGLRLFQGIEPKKPDDPPGETHAGDLEHRLPSPVG